MDPTSISQCGTRSVGANTVYISRKTVWDILLDIYRDTLAIGRGSVQVRYPVATGII